MKRKKIGNKGFSLVELIIVIAIIAVLVGLMAPQLIKYIEKSKIASDQETLNAIYSAVVYAANDPNVVQDNNCNAVLAAILNPMKLEDLENYNDTKFYDEVLSSLGWDSIQQSEYVKLIESAHTNDAEIMFMYKGSAINPIAMWITHTDETGGKDTSEAAATYLDIDKNISIK